MEIIIILLMPLLMMLLMTAGSKAGSALGTRHKNKELAKSAKEIEKVYDPDAPVSDHLAQMEHDNQEYELKTTGAVLSGLSKHSKFCQKCYPPPDPAEIARKERAAIAREEARVAAANKKAIKDYMDKYPPGKLFYGVPAMPPKGIRATWVTYAGGAGELQYDEKSLDAYRGKSTLKVPKAILNMSQEHNYEITSWDGSFLGS